MFVIIDYRGETARFAAVTGRTAQWVTLRAKPGSFAPLAKAFAKLGVGTTRPTAIVVCQHDKELGAAHVSWSTVRAAVAVGNTLAFAWGIPVVTLRVNGQEAPAATVAAARVAVSSAVAGKWIAPLYDGLPNITVKVATP